MRPRRLLAAVAGPALVAILVVVAGSAVQHTGATSSTGRITRDAAVVMVDGVSQAAVDASAPPQRITALATIAAYLTAAVSVALVFAFWNADGVSLWSLITGAGLARRRRAPPLARG